MLLQTDWENNAMIYQTKIKDVGCIIIFDLII